MSTSLRIFIVNVQILIIVLVLIEVFKGDWVFGVNFLYLRVPRDMVRHYDARPVYGGGTITTYKRDTYGLRGAYDNPARIDMLAVGGSTTSEELITEGATWTDLLASEFVRHGRNFTVVNAGMSGQSTIGLLRDFEWWYPRVPRLKARFVLAYVGLDDRERAITGAPSPDDELLEKEEPQHRYVLNNSALYALWRNVRAMLTVTDGREIHHLESVPLSEWREPPAPPDVAAAETRLAPALDAYADRLREFVRLARVKLGAHTVLITQSRADFRMRNGHVLGRVRPDGTVDTGAYADLAAFNRRTLAVCLEVRAHCVDLATELEFGDGDHYDVVHTTPQGSRRIAEYLHGKLFGFVR